jgi:hypothetical protein
VQALDWRYGFTLEDDAAPHALHSQDADASFDQLNERYPFPSRHFVRTLIRACSKGLFLSSNKCGREILICETLTQNSTDASEKRDARTKPKCLDASTTAAASRRTAIHARKPALERSNVPWNQLTRLFRR